MGNKKYHVLICTAWYKSEINETEGSFVEEQARLLQAKGYKVSVVHPYLKGTFVGTLLDRKSEL